MIECCGNCERYTYEGKDKKGYCDWYRSYYYPTDSCSHFKEGDENVREGSSGSCFLTTACCGYKGLPDNCLELETLRAFRDGYLKNQEYGPELIKMYYEDAPAIVQMIQSKPDCDTIWQSIYEKIQIIVKQIQNERFDDAIINYMVMVYGLKRQEKSE